MKLLLSIILIFTILFSSTSCILTKVPINNTDTTSDSTSPCTADSTQEESEDLPPKVSSTTHSGLKHYEIKLNSENFTNYLAYSSETVHIIGSGYHSDYTHKIEGVLSFAYYEDVVVSFEVTYEDPYSDKIHKGIYSVPLNASGCAEFSADNPTLLNAIKGTYDRSMNKTFTIIYVSGKVIFNI